MIHRRGNIIKSRIKSAIALMKDCIVNQYIISQEELAKKEA